MAKDDINHNHLEATLGGIEGYRNEMDLFANTGLTHSHSRGIKPHMPGLANQLLSAPNQALPEIDDTRPLIDLLQQATFGDSIPMQWVTDKYALRTLLRKAHCFRLDAETSAMVVDFSLAVASDLEATRHLAIPPFPVTWFEIDNIARLNHTKARGISLTSTAQREDVCTRVGWLISPATDLAGSDGYYATYCTVVAQGVMLAPLSFFWHPGEQEIGHGLSKLAAREVERICFGVNGTNVSPIDAFPTPTPFQAGYGSEQQIALHIRDLMTELSGELRHIWGLLLALGAGHLGAQTVTSDQPISAGPHPMAKGKPVLPLVHKVLTIRLAKRATVEKITARAITGVKHRWHEVRGHFRTKLNPDGSVKWRIPIKAHARGDERLGKIEKTYKVER